MSTSKKEKWQPKKNLTAAVWKLRNFSFSPPPPPFFDINFNTTKILEEKHQKNKNKTLDCEAGIVWGRENGHNWACPDRGAGKSQKGHTKFSTTFSFSNYKINASCRVTSHTTSWFIIQPTRWRDWAKWRKYEKEMVWKHLISMHV